MLRLCSDIGGVIIARPQDSVDTTFLTDDFLETPAIEDAFEALAVLNDELHGEVYLLSRASNNTEERTRTWLERRGFFFQTKIKPSHLHFCRERADKGTIAAQLGITHMVDDRLEVLSHMKQVPHRYLFRPEAQEIQRFGRQLLHVEITNSWREVVELVRTPDDSEPSES